MLIVALGLLYAHIPVTPFSNFLENGRFSPERVTNTCNLSIIKQNAVHNTFSQSSIYLEEVIFHNFSLNYPLHLCVCVWGVGGGGGGVGH